MQPLAPRSSCSISGRSPAPPYFLANQGRNEMKKRTALEEAADKVRDALSIAGPNSAETLTARAELTVAYANMWRANLADDALRALAHMAAAMKAHESCTGETLSGLQVMSALTGKSAQFLDKQAVDIRRMLEDSVGKMPRGKLKLITPK